MIISILNVSDLLGSPKRPGSILKASFNWSCLCNLEFSKILLMPRRTFISLVQGYQLPHESPPSSLRDGRLIALKRLRKICSLLVTRKQAKRRCAQHARGHQAIISIAYTPTFTMEARVRTRDCLSSSIGQHYVTDADRLLSQRVRPQSHLHRS